MTRWRTERVAKLDAARRQLATAIELWFIGGDAVSIHTLAYAAYEIGHAVSKKKHGRTSPLLLDSDLIKDEYRSEWAVLVKKAPVFFKHGDRDPDGEIDFTPDSNLHLMLFASAALAHCGAPQTVAGVALYNWIAFHRPKLLTEAGRKLFFKGKGVNEIEQAKSVPKDQFFQAIRILHGDKFPAL